MSKTKSKILLSILLILVLVSSYCFATVEPRTSEPEATSEDVSAISETDETETTEITTSNWVNSDLYVAEDVVTIDKVVDGNAFVVGKEVTITGEIGGDLFVCADKLNIEGGYVYSSIFACANEITINGVVYDVYAFCNTLNLESDGFIYRDMKVAGTNVNINGKIRRDAYITCSNITFAESSSTLIYGNLEYSSGTEATIPEGAVAGEVKYSATEQIEETEINVGSIILSYVTDLLQTLVYTFVVALLLVWLTPKFVERVGKMSVAKSFASLGIGFATPIALIIVGIILLISSVGASIFLSGIFAFVLLAFVGHTIASIFFGRIFTKVLKMEGNVKFILFTLLSSLIIWAICQIPVLGGFFSFIIAIFGIGTTIVNMVYKKEKVEEKTEVNE